MYEQLCKLLDLIKQDAADKYAEWSRTVVFLGDYVDRGAQSKDVVSLLMTQPLKSENFNEVYLKGNHEELMEEYCAGKDEHHWLVNGGEETLESYGGKVSEEHRKWIAALHDFYVEDGFYFAHAGVNPENALEQQEPHDLYWVRGPFLKCDHPFLFEGHPVKVVHGHSPTVEPELRDNRIGIDTCAYHTGILTAVVLDGTEERFLQAEGAPAPNYKD